MDSAWDRARPYFETDAVAHVATLMADGSPHSVPVWVGVEGDRLAIFMIADSPKDKHLQREPRIALSVTNPDNPQDMAYVRGRAAERIAGDDAMPIVDRISQVYTGGPYGERSGFVAYLIEPTKAWSRDYTAM